MRWYYTLNDEQHGPVGDAAVRHLFTTGVISHDTLLWHDGLPGWVPLGDTDFAGPRAAPLRGRNEPRLGGAETPVVFAGSAGEYFRIWIVNLVLTALTLGIYAAWAKVRKRRYFYGNTLLAGKPFDYTGNPIAILKGNLVIGAALVLYSVTSTFMPLLAVVFLLIFAGAFPWLFYRAMRFNAHNTRHRNIRFHFRGSMDESYTINLGLAILIPFTLGLIWPYIQFRKKRYQLGNLMYGTARFRFLAESGPFYGYFFKALGMILVILLAVALIAPFFAWDSLNPEAGELVSVFIGYAAVVLIMPGYYFTKITNYSLGRTAVEGIATLRSSMRVRDVVAIEVTSILAIICSLGLAIPWAAIRRARYRFSHLHVAIQGDLESVAAAMAAHESAVGDAAADMLDLDVSL